MALIAVISFLIGSFLTLACAYLYTIERTRVMKRDAILALALQAGDSFTTGYMRALRDMKAVGDVQDLNPAETQKILITI